MNEEAKTQEVLEQLGAPPAEIAQDLQEFRKAARVLSANYPRLIDQYPNQWVGVYQGKVRAHGRTLKSLLSQLTEKGFPKQKVIVRFIDRNQRTMIL